MRRILILVLFALALAACGEKPASIESVESLVANPQRLKELREACKADHAKAESTRFAGLSRPHVAIGPTLVELGAEF